MKAAFLRNTAVICQSAPMTLVAHIALMAVCVLLTACAIPDAGSSRSIGSDSRVGSEVEEEQRALAATHADRLSAWRHVRIAPNKKLTHYTVERTSDGRATFYAIRANARGSASTLWRKVALQSINDLDIEWSWSKELDPAGNNPAQREADDAAARLMLAFDGDKSSLPLREQVLLETAKLLTGEEPPYAVLIYAASTSHAPGTVVVNPRTTRVRTIVVPRAAGPSWAKYRRNIKADYKLAFGESPGRLLGVGLMTDADNSASSAAALYGPIQFVGTSAAKEPAAAATVAQ
jgi:hypothetical protein